MRLSDAVLNTFLQKLFGRPVTRFESESAGEATRLPSSEAMDSLEKLDLARCRGAGLLTTTGISLLRHNRAQQKKSFPERSGYTHGKWNWQTHDYCCGGAQSQKLLLSAGPERSTFGISQNTLSSPKMLSMPAY